jgi:hypothetical protein
VTAIVLSHERNAFAATIEDTRKVGLNGGIPFLDREFIKSLENTNAGVVHQDIEAAVFRRDLLERGAHRCGVGDIERKRAGVSTKLGRACRQCIGIASVQQDARTGCGKSLCDRPADATGTSRDKGEATAQVEGGGVSYWGRAPSRSAASGAAWCSAAPPD